MKKIQWKGKNRKKINKSERNIEFISKISNVILWLNNDIARVENVGNIRELQCVESLQMNDHIILTLDDRVTKIALELFARMLVA